MEGLDPALDFRASSHLSHSLPCIRLSIKYRVGALFLPGNVPWNRPARAFKPRRKTPALPVQTLLGRKRLGASLLVARSWFTPLSPLPCPLGTVSHPFPPCLGGQHVPTLRGVEMAAGMWAGKKRKREKKEENLEACPNLLMFILEPVSDIRAGRV